MSNLSNLGKYAHPRGKSSNVAAKIKSDIPEYPGDKADTKAQVKAEKKSGKK